MSQSYFNPFENLLFEDNVCFLTGEDLNETNKESVYFFPEWVMEQFDCWDRKIVMMDPQNSYLFKDLKLPCTKEVKEKFDALDKEIQNAFVGGYEAMKNMDSERLFLWMAKIVYGMLYYELQIERRESLKKGEPFQMHDYLKRRFGFFHLMLQSIMIPIEYGTLKPWSISIVKLKYSGNYFNYRDDSVNLMFSLGVKGFGMICVFQDNGTITEKHREILDKIGDKELHAIQFEELCAHFQYSNYLLQYKPKYSLAKNAKGQLHINSYPIVADEERPLFGQWEDTMFAKVLAGYWKPWGLEEKDIMKSEQPITFLEDAYTYELIDSNAIDLPY